MLSIENAYLDHINKLKPLCHLGVPILYLRSNKTGLCSFWKLCVLIFYMNMMDFGVESFKAIKTDASKARYFIQSIIL